MYICTSWFRIHQHSESSSFLNADFLQYGTKYLGNLFGIFEYFFKCLVCKTSHWKCTFAVQGWPHTGIWTIDQIYVVGEIGYDCATFFVIVIITWAFYIKSETARSLALDLFYTYRKWASTNQADSFFYCFFVFYLSSDRFFQNRKRNKKYVMTIPTKFVTIVPKVHFWTQITVMIERNYLRKN